MATTYTLGPVTADVVPGKPPRKYAISVSCPVVDDSGKPVRSKTMNCRAVYPLGPKLPTTVYPPGPKFRTKTAMMKIRDGVATCVLPLASTDPSGAYRIECSKTGAATVSAMVEVPGA